MNHSILATEEVQQKELDVFFLGLIKPYLPPKARICSTTSFMDNYLCSNASKNGELTCPQSSLPLFGDRGGGYTESSPPSLIYLLIL